MVQFSARDLQNVATPQPSPPGDAQARELSPIARMIAAQPMAPAISQIVLAGTLRIAEFFCLSGLGIAIYLGYVGFSDEFAEYVIATAGIAAATIIVLQWLELYDIATLRTRVLQLSRVSVALAAVFLVAFAISFFAKLDGTFSRLWVAFWFSASLFALYAGRLIVSSLVRKWTREGRLIRRTVIVGGGPAGESLVESLQAQKESDLQICGFFDDRSDDRSQNKLIGVPKLGNVDDLVEFARRTRLDLLLVSLPITAEERVLQMVRKLWVLPVDL